MAGLPEEKVSIEGGWGSALLGMSITVLSLLMMALIAFFPQSSVESFVLSLITASCLLGIGSAILTLVSDYPLILSSLSIFLLLLYWRLRNTVSTWLLVLSILTFVLALVLHKRNPERRGRARSRRVRKPQASSKAL